MRKRRGISTKALVALLALVLVIGCSLGGTLAWFVDETDPVTNTFTVGNIKITLTETEREYKILPGVNIPKDPTVKVEANSEACWLFVQVKEDNWPDFKNGNDRKVNYSIADGWVLLEGKSDVYYQKVDAVTAKAGKECPVLAGDVVTVSENLTKSEVNQVKNNQPTLTITAYAVQLQKGNGEFTAAEAWEIAQNNGNP